MAPVDGPTDPDGKSDMTASTSAGKRSIHKNGPPDPEWTRTKASWSMKMFDRPAGQATTVVKCLKFDVDNGSVKYDDVEESHIDDSEHWTALEPVAQAHLRDDVVEATDPEVQGGVEEARREFLRASYKSVLDASNKSGHALYIPGGTSSLQDIGEAAGDDAERAHSPSLVLEASQSMALNALLDDEDDHVRAEVERERGLPQSEHVIRFGKCFKTARAAETLVRTWHGPLRMVRPTPIDPSHPFRHIHTHTSHTHSPIHSGTRMRNGQARGMFCSLCV